MFTLFGTTWHVYIVECNDGTLYCGVAKDVEKRMEQHNSSHLGAKYTRSRRPVKLVHVESFETRSLAMKRECQIKRMSHAQKESLFKQPERFEQHNSAVQKHDDHAEKKVMTEHPARQINPDADDFEVFGDQWVYCRSHKNPHKTGWCTVSPQNKVALGVDTYEEAVEKCIDFGFELFR